MTLLREGEFWEGLVVQNNPAFQARRKSKQESLEQAFFARTLFAAQQANRQGYPITAATLREVNSDLPAQQVAELLGTDRFLNALDELGIKVAAPKGLSARQLAMVAIYLDTSNPATLNQKLKMAGVSRSEWDNWNLQADFADRVSELAEDRVKQLTPLAEIRLEQAVDRGEPWALQFALAMTKRFDPRAEQGDPAAAIREIMAAIDAVLPREMIERLSSYMQAKREGRDPFDEPQAIEVVSSVWSEPGADTIAPEDHHTQED